MRITCKAPAKINLRLKVEGRRDDGYHLLSMLNASLEFADELAFEFKAGNEIELVTDYHTPGFGDDQNELLDPALNLAFKAARLFSQEFGFNFGLKIHLRKSIPLGAGLGGGSSDAAAVLRVLQAVFARELPEQFAPRFREMALKLGADVPFFLSSGFSIVKGIGERITELDPSQISGRAVYLYLSQIKIPTAVIFKIHREKLRSSGPDHSLTPENSNFYMNLIENDLESSLKDYRPELIEALSQLRKTPGMKAGLSGSGATLFAIPEDQRTPPPAIYVGKAEIKPYKTSFLPIPVTVVN